ncbi:MAG: type VI secretion system contractile sheath small subunit [Thalassolituus maritimus]|jgi:type VI secretion system protein ImpB|uniref:Type VI secretion system protein ImpB n=1 Tax=Thalassolituus maritimus TaxID=484498 RepID=A0A1N7P4J0_9GAMM|nr:type VI secretion system contractile sheath small subunit [Thalassolituus maritimus]MEE3190293.1 type VI secretion system contractile sheath small subunit [Pseudomonadota bacterium]TPD54808.1 MAG: type VI secretion system contractile sheath small subunit [Thalassolituus maritimus]SIT05532.1 type VI secretion system protein ImpB [Thalassolituus maritimus]
MSESIHNKLKRVRKPRVHITYDVETNGAEVKKELPFVAGVMGDYSGDNAENRKALKERKFVQIDRDNFNEVMGKVNPKLNLQVENTLAGEGNTMAVDLDFRKMDDFTPEAIVEQVEPLKQLLDARNKLRDLLSKADRSEELETVLEQILKNTDNITEISQQLGVGESKEGAE